MQEKLVQAPELEQCQNGIQLQTLLSALTKLKGCDKVEDACDDIVGVSACIDPLDEKSQRRSLSQSRKTKTLFGGHHALHKPFLFMPQLHSSAREKCGLVGIPK